MTILTSGAFGHNLYYSMRNIIKTGLLLLKSYTVPEVKVSCMYSINNYCQWDVLSSIAKQMFTLSSTHGSGSWIGLRWTDKECETWVLCWHKATWRLETPTAFTGYCVNLSMYTWATGIYFSQPTNKGVRNLCTSPQSNLANIPGSATLFFFYSLLIVHSHVRLRSRFWINISLMTGNVLLEVIFQIYVQSYQSSCLCDFFGNKFLRKEIPMRLIRLLDDVKFSSLHWKVPSSTTVECAALSSLTRCLKMGIYLSSTAIKGWPF